LIEDYGTLLRCILTCGLVKKGKWKRICNYSQKEALLHNDEMIRVRVAV